MPIWKSLKWLPSSAVLTDPLPFPAFPAQLGCAKLRQSKLGLPVCRWVPGRLWKLGMWKWAEVILLLSKLFCDGKVIVKMCLLDRHLGSSSPNHPAAWRHQESLSLWLLVLYNFPGLGPMVVFCSGIHPTKRFFKTCCEALNAMFDMIFCFFFSSTLFSVSFIKFRVAFVFKCLF